MRILITGITGFIGRNLANHWATEKGMTVAGTGRGEQKPVHLLGDVEYLPLQLTDADAVLQAITGFQPDVVVHSAAMSKPNDCETERERCYDVNVNATRHIVDACKTTRSRLVYMSTDFVFGDNGPFAEDDPYDPVNYYGQSKVFAEQVIKESGLNFSIVRTVLVYGKQLPGLSPTFPQWAKANLEQGKTIRVFTDQFRTATYVLDLVNGIDAMVRQNANGIFHLCGEETLTPFEIARKVAAHFSYDAALVKPVTRAEFAEPARRPIRSTLHIHKAKSELGFKPRSLSDVLPDLF